MYTPERKRIVLEDSPTALFRKCSPEACPVSYDFLSQKSVDKNELATTRKRVLEPKHRFDISPAPVCCNRRVRKIPRLRQSETLEELTGSMIYKDIFNLCNGMKTDNENYGDKKSEEKSGENKSEDGYNNLFDDSSNQICSQAAEIVDEFSLNGTELESTVHVSVSPCENSLSKGYTLVEGYNESAERNVMRDSNLKNSSDQQKRQSVENCKSISSFVKKNPVSVEKKCKSASKSVYHHSKATNNNHINRTDNQCDVKTCDSIKNVTTGASNKNTSHKLPSTNTGTTSGVTLKESNISSLEKASRRHISRTNAPSRSDRDNSSRKSSSSSSSAGYEFSEFPHLHNHNNVSLLLEDGNDDGFVDIDDTMLTSLCSVSQPIAVVKSIPLQVEAKCTPQEIEAKRKEAKKRLLEKKKINALPN